MQPRTRAVYGAVLLGLGVLMAVFVTGARSAPATASYVALFGLAGVLYIASARPPASVESHHLWGAGEASIGLAFLAMAVSGALDAVPWVVAVLVGTLIGVTQVWQGARRVRGVDDPGGSWVR